MYKHFLIVIISLFAALGVSSSNINSEVELVEFINDNIDVMREEYNSTFNMNWEVTEFLSYKPLYDIDDNEFAYILNFDVGYLVVDENLQIRDMSIIDSQLLLDYSSKTYLIGTGYYKKVGDNLVPNSINTPIWGSIPRSGLVISDIYHDYTTTEIGNYDNFQVTMSLANDLRDKNGNYGDYSIYTRYQGSTTDCGPQAGVNWMYTFDFSGAADIPRSNNSNTELANMRTEMGWTTTGQDYLGLVFVGTWPSDFKSGVADYTDNDFFVSTSSAYLDETPAVGLYYNLNVADTAHYAMVIGQAQSDNWWIFKHNWDIISTWSANYNHYYGFITTKKSGTPSYHFVKSNYRQSTYVLYERLYPKWYEVWKPTSQIVKK